MAFTGNFMSTSFKLELMKGCHDFTLTTGDAFKLALYDNTPSFTAATTAYSATGEVTGTNYSAGGVTVTNATAPASTNTSATAGVAYWTPSASLVYTNVTLSTAFDTVLIYNSTQSNKAVSVHTFGSQTITAGTFTLTMPSNTTSTALLRLSTT